MYILKKKKKKIRRIKYHITIYPMESSLLLITFSVTFSAIRRLKSCLIAFYYLHAQICSTHP